MKTLCAFGSFLILIFLQANVTSCKKETVVVTLTDTLYVNSDIPITTSLITANSWMMQEARGVSGSKIFYYVRGGVENTQSFDNEFFKFNSDGTGSYRENAGANRAITWNFAKPDNSEMHIYFTNTPASFKVTWENIRLKEGKLYYDEYYTDGNTSLNAHGQFIRVKGPGI